MGLDIFSVVGGKTRDDADRTGAAGGNLHRLPVAHAPGRSVRGGAAAAARPLSRIDHVIAVYRLQAAGSAYDAAGCLISLTVGAWSLCPEPPPCR